MFLSLVLSNEILKMCKREYVSVTILSDEIKNICVRYFVTCNQEGSSEPLSLGGGDWNKGSFPNFASDIK